MPRYFFHLTDGSATLTDAVGRQVPGIVPARRLVLEQGPAIIASLKPVILVTDEEGRQVYAAAFREGEPPGQSKLAHEIQLLSRTECLAEIGGWELDLSTHTLSWTRGVFDVLGLPFGATPTYEDALALFEEDSQKLFAQKIFDEAERTARFDFEMKLKAASRKVRVSGIWAKIGSTTRVFGVVAWIHDEREQIWSGRWQIMIPIRAFPTESFSTSGSMKRSPTQTGAA